MAEMPILVCVMYHAATSQVRSGTLLCCMTVPAFNGSQRRQLEHHHWPDGGRAVPGTSTPQWWHRSPLRARTAAK